MPSTVRLLTANQTPPILHHVLVNPITNYHILNIHFIFSRLTASELLNCTGHYIKAFEYDLGNNLVATEYRCYQGQTVGDIVVLSPIDTVVILTGDKPRSFYVPPRLTLTRRRLAANDSTTSTLFETLDDAFCVQYF